MAPLLEIRDLHVSYTARTGQVVTALAGVSFALERGETLGVLGESGSGKSTLAAALLRMLPPSGAVERGSVLFEGQQILQAEPRDLQKIRGARIALIFPEPSISLHPTMRVGEQVSNVIAAHKNLNKGHVREKTQQILATLFPNETERIANSYPHQLSGGQRARVLIAQAISCEPSLIVADEPTASLDAGTQQEMLSLFRELRQKFHLTLIWITHNPSLLSGFADRVLVLYAGRVVEVGPEESVLFSPQHPYAQALLRCVPPQLGDGFAKRKEKLPVISGEAPGSVLDAGGCRFEPRCTERMDVCRMREPEMVRLRTAHEAACFKLVG